MDSATVIASEPSFFVEALGPVAITLWRGTPPERDQIRRGIQALTAHARASRQAALIVGIPPDIALPTEDIRRTISEEMRQLDPFLVCGATVVSRPGLAGIAMRAVVSTLQLVSRTTHPEKIFATVTDASIYVEGVLRRARVACPPATEIARHYGEMEHRARTPAG